MATEKLFYEDAYLREFTATVRSCTEHGSDWMVTLDRTAFYPEGGGQPGDTGSLGGVPVLDTHEKDGEVFHYCTEPLPVGTCVTGAIDWERRFDLMQQHSGEHIVSGIICSTFGCDNVGFHLGSDRVVIDFNCAVAPEQLAEIERRANAVIWENRPFQISFPSPEALPKIPYRSKKELTGSVRIVECPGADCCACCGTHVKSAGELGLIKLLSGKPFRDGVRIEMLSGRRAYDYISKVTAQNDCISVLLSAKTGETAVAVQRIQEELSAVKYRLAEQENRVFSLRAKEFSGRGDVLLFENGLSADAVRRCCDTVGQTCGGRCAVFSGADGDWKYAVSCHNGDLREFAKAMNLALHGRGGGKPNFIQGNVSAVRAEIEEYFKQI